MTTTDRLKSVLSQINPATSAVDQICQKNPDDVVITLAIRTPLCKYKKGGMKDTTLDDMVFKLLEQVRAKCGIDPAQVDDICLGNVNEGRAAHYCRAAALAAGFPNTTAASSSSRFCSSGLTATCHIANEIASGMIDVGIAIGAESLSEGNQRLPRAFADNIMKDREAEDCMLPMGITSENVASDFNITRDEQDRYAVESYKRAEAAQKAGLFNDELVPITVKKDGQDLLISQDEVRWGTTFENINKLKPSFTKDGKSTPGNSSQITDGAAALVLMRRSKALELGQPILGKYVATSIAGLAPRIMGIGPSIVIPKLLSRLGLDLHKDVDVVEINEAFASMAVYCRDKLEVDWSKMNPRGGAIALGHPFGMTGVRQIVTGLSECRRTKKKVLLTSMCLGTGMGMAGVFVNEAL
ncbi:3-ketoacyl-CoA thiolase, peroxisomal [Fulvia fulva]|uniref:3-ketoacyl-CoA thiolase, peroxisomal n=1 Tax=Passalora fulva TaxID=5499 RepID=A0A9Q8P4E7_PASFU|nr:3-ketoacyl-CoA thiolase, peroxisomal [Fulvia fulva]KAK4634295.1 3-ketoacyl-CoA thiolase, peroxisomal [Fulvia fulva]KAK4638484.1 3-ketoacyl-CoA thiolase, peroxisomal [Fulvia fulva]UJO12736.1 3-ketoacyl-CoA thiolase, peroxisomal [Fulvia fulva]WPV09196.1 3-ketoacyl-CoA thiolase, peroxisomal [Fulvia fulva]WPV25046.1 3-ketoacyl-CoA thiolase, peroxisomal [Fulvia fulva]